MKSYEIRNALLEELSDLVDARHRENLTRLSEQHSLANEARQSETGFLLAMLTGFSEAPWSAAPEVTNPAGVRRQMLARIRDCVQKRRDSYASRIAKESSDPHSARLIESDAVLEMIDGLAATPHASHEPFAYRLKRIPAPTGFDPRRHSGCIWVSGQLLPYTRDVGPCNRADGLLLITVHHPDGSRPTRAPLERLIRKRQIRMPRHHARRAAAPPAQPDAPLTKPLSAQERRAFLLEGL